MNLKDGPLTGAPIGFPNDDGGGGSFATATSIVPQSFQLLNGIGNPTTADIEFFYTGSAATPALTFELEGASAFCSFVSATLTGDVGTSPRRLTYSVTMLQTAGSGLPGNSFAFLTADGFTCVANTVNFSIGIPP